MKEYKKTLHMMAHGPEHRGWDNYRGNNDEMTFYGSFCKGHNMASV